jgi:hypothetical protein
MDDFAPSAISLQTEVNGTATYNIETSLDDPDSPSDPVPVGQMNWFPSSDPNLVDATISQQSNFAFAPCFIRINITAGAGTVILKVLQSSNGPI